MFLEHRSKTTYWVFIVLLLFCGITICVSLYKAQNDLKLSTDVACASKNLRYHATNTTFSCYPLTHSNTGRFIRQPNPRGRLGNNMFQFASTLGIAATLGYKPMIWSSNPLLKVFNINPMYISNISVTNVLSFTDSQWRNEKWRNTTKLHSFNLTMNGFFQSWKYFSSIENCVRDMLTIKPLYLEQAKRFLKRKELQNKTIIGIHVRRTDLARDDSKQIGRVAGLSYFKKAMEYFRSRCKNVHFVVCSDDMKWSRANLNISDVTFSIFREPITDLSLLSLCDHVIMTVGTFGWWGGWLSGGTVVHFGRPGLADGNYFPHNWIGMSN